jgi:CRISPR type IV-associated protein Csf3
MASPELMPLRVRAWLRSPVVADQWLPLDGALFYQSARADLGERVVTISGASLDPQPKGEAMRGGRLPLAYVHARDWYYKCSWAGWGPHADGVDYWSKRFDNPLADLVDFRSKRGKIDTSAAEYKAYRMPLFYRSALWVEWYCVGDADRLAPLLHMITHLGKKTSQGYGRVSRWEIEPWPEDWSVWRDGKLMRGIPRYHWPRERGVPVVGLYGIRPPYWDKRNQMELVMP